MSDTTSQVPHPLEKRSGETYKAYSALIDYYEMGSGRSLPKLTKLYQDWTDSGQNAPTKFLSTLKLWSSKYLWQKRVAAAEQLDLKAFQALMLSRQVDVVRQDYEQGQQLRDLVVAFLDEGESFTKETRKTIKGKDGEPDQVLIILRPDISAMTKALDLSSKLQRQATGIKADEVAATIITISLTGNVSPEDV